MFFGDSPIRDAVAERAKKEEGKWHWEPDLIRRLMELENRLEMLEEHIGVKYTTGPRYEKVGKE